MPPRAVLNFVYVHLKPKGDGVEEKHIEQYDADLYAPLDSRLITEIDLRRD